MIVLVRTYCIWAIFNSNIYFVLIVRESGHDTTYRFDGRCANLATVDLNSLIYKYEKDLEALIEKFGKGR